MTNPSLAEIEVLTRARFPSYASGPLALEPLEKGGSDRKFYRIRPSPADPLIFVQYGRQREENSHYVEIGDFLQKAGVRVPLMFLHEPESGRIWMDRLPRARGPISARPWYQPTMRPSMRRRVTST